MRLDSTHLVYGFIVEGFDIIKCAKHGDWFKQYVIEATEEDDSDEMLAEDCLWEDFIADEIFNSDTLHDFIRGQSFEDSFFIFGYEIVEDTFTAKHINSFTKLHQENVIDEYRYFMGTTPNKEPQFYLFNTM